MNNISMTVFLLILFIISQPEQIFWNLIESYFEIHLHKVYFFFLSYNLVSILHHFIHHLYLYHPHQFLYPIPSRLPLDLALSFVSLAAVFG